MAGTRRVEHTQGLRPRPRRLRPCRRRTRVGRRRRLPVNGEEVGGITMAIASPLSVAPPLGSPVSGGTPPRGDILPLASEAGLLQKSSRRRSTTPSACGYVANVNEYVLTLRCPDHLGIVHALARGLLDSGSNILEQAQFTDPDLNLFCLLTRFESPEPSHGCSGRRHLRVRRFDPVITSARKRDARRAPDGQQVRPLPPRPALPQATGELPVDVPLIVSNHDDCGRSRSATAFPLCTCPSPPRPSSGRRRTYWAW